MIDLRKNEAQIAKNAKICAERNIVLPTYAQMANPSTIPEDIKQELRAIGRDEAHSRNLFRVNWENERVDFGGGFAGVNHLSIPFEISGVRARIIGMSGKFFPTGSHKVGAAFSCLAPTLVSGQFNPEENMAVWPSTGNYCRGGAYISRLLTCKSAAILPEEMSRERFEWLEKMADEIIATPGSESNVKEIFDKCHELESERGADVFIFNQFDQMPNHLWHHEVTGAAMEKLFRQLSGSRGFMAGICLSSGSAGTLGSASYIKKLFPASKLAVSEALQCPTLTNNGFGAHRIEGIGDKHVPWVHNVRDTDMVIAIDDEHAIRLLRLFNEEVGREYLSSQGVPDSTLDGMDLLGISGICNLLTAIKFAKYYELDEEDVVMTVFTDSEAMYASRLEELRQERGIYTRENAIADYQLLSGMGVDHTHELSYQDRKRIHNLKYYTWVEQQGKTYDEINAQWYQRDYWDELYKLSKDLDKMIEEFNRRVLSLKR